MSRQQAAAAASSGSSRAEWLTNSRCVVGGAVVFALEGVAVAFWLYAVAAAGCCCRPL